MKTFKGILFLILTLTLSHSCSRLKYSAWESIGVEKRDLFKREVSNVKENQEESTESFQDALSRLKEVYSFDGGDLEKHYKRLNKSYENSKEEATEVSEDIKELETVAGDLFNEWKKEIKEISSKDLRKQSNKQLKETQSKYDQLHKSLKSAESKMQPVLTNLRDQVLFLKHNLNAQAVAGLKSEGQKIESDIELLIKEMKASTQEAKDLIEAL